MVEVGVGVRVRIGPLRLVLGLRLSLKVGADIGLGWI